MAGRRAARRRAAPAITFPSHGDANLLPRPPGSHIRAIHDRGMRWRAAPGRRRTPRRWCVPSRSGDRRRRHARRPGDRRGPRRGVEAAERPRAVGAGPGDGHRLDDHHRPHGRERDDPRPGHREHRRQVGRRHRAPRRQRAQVQPPRQGQRAARVRDPLRDRIQRAGAGAGCRLTFAIAGYGRARFLGTGTYRLNSDEEKSWTSAWIKVAPSASPTRRRFETCTTCQPSPVIEP